MNFIQIEKDLHLQLCTIQNPICTINLKQLQKDIMYYIKKVINTMTHTRQGTMEVPHQQYYSIGVVLKNGKIYIELWYETEGGYRGGFEK